MFNLDYAAILASVFQTKKELENYISEYQLQDRSNWTLHEQTVAKAKAEYAKTRLDAGCYKETPDWSSVHFKNGALIGNELPPDGCWVLWKTANEEIFSARFKVDAVDHFWPQAEHPIEDVIGWKWLYVQKIPPRWKKDD